MQLQCLDVTLLLVPESPKVTAAAMSAAAARVNSSADTIVRQRTRQGCLTCRKRRRKCDEQKPKCQNCIGKELSCRYGVQITFLQTNTLSRLPEEAQALQVTPRKTYKTLKFVNGLDKATTPDGSPVEEYYSQDDHNPASSPEAFRSPILAPPVEGWRTYNPMPKDGPAIEQHEIDQYLHSQTLLTPRVEPIERTGDVNVHHYESIPFTPASILHTIVPERFEREFQPSVTPQSLSQLRQCNPISPPIHDAMSANNHYLRPPQRTRNNIETITRQRRERNVKHQFEYSTKDSLLKFYIDEVAPWLDTCTAEYSFGIQLPILSKQSPHLLDAIRALACCQISFFLPLGDADMLQSAEVTRNAIASSGSNIYSGSEESIAACVLLMICELMPQVVPDWHLSLKECIDVLSSLSIHGFLPGHRGSVSWVILRLDIANSLICQIPLITQIQNWPEVPYPFSNLEPSQPEQNNSKSCDWTRYSILICSRAAQYLFSSQDSSSASHSGHAERWTHLWSSTQWWSQHQPPQLQPILSSAISNIAFDQTSAFPLTIHTSRANLLASIMYHTACLLLLQARPPTLQRISKMKTPTWYAVQICGLSISNDLNWSCDPVIMAALVYAGRLISYQEQKDELEDFLWGVAKVSGWQIADQIEDMLEGWRADGNL